MKYITELFVVLLSVCFTLHQAQYIEMPSDMYNPCQMGGYYDLPFEELPTSDFRIKRQQKLSLGERIENIKRNCAANLGISKEDIPEDLMNVENPSPQLKCLLACILQRLQLMTKNNLLNLNGIETLADEVGNYNPLVTSIAIALAQQFNVRLAALNIKDQCEAGYIINQYIAGEMKARNLNIPY